MRATNLTDAGTYNLLRTSPVSPNTSTALSAHLPLDVCGSVCSACAANSTIQRQVLPNSPTAADTNQDNTQETWNIATIMQCVTIWGIQPCTVWTRTVGLLFESSGSISLNGSSILHVEFPRWCSCRLCPSFNGGGDGSGNTTRPTSLTIDKIELTLSTRTLIIRASSRLSLPSLTVDLSQLFTEETLVKFGSEPQGVWKDEQELNVKLSEDAMILRTANQVSASSNRRRRTLEASSASGVTISLLLSGWRLSGQPDIVASVSENILRDGIEVILPNDVSSTGRSSGSSTAPSSTGLQSSTGPCQGDCQVQVPPNDGGRSSDSFFDSNTNKIGLGVGIGAGVVLIATIVLCVMCGRRGGQLHSKRRAAAAAGAGAGGVGANGELGTSIVPGSPTSSNGFVGIGSPSSTTSPRLSSSKRSTKSSPVRSPMLSGVAGGGANGEIILHMITEEEDGDEFSRSVRPSSTTTTRPKLRIPPPPLKTVVHGSPIREETSTPSSNVGGTSPIPLQLPPPHDEAEELMLDLGDITVGVAAVQTPTTEVHNEIELQTLLASMDTTTTKGEKEDQLETQETNDTVDLESDVAPTNDDDDDDGENRLADVLSESIAQVEKTSSEEDTVREQKEDETTEVASSSSSPPPASADPPADVSVAIPPVTLASVLAPVDHVVATPTVEVESDVTNELLDVPDDFTLDDVIFERLDGVTTEAEATTEVDASQPVEMDMDDGALPVIAEPNVELAPPASSSSSTTARLLPELVLDVSATKEFPAIQPHPDQTPLPSPTPTEAPTPAAEAASPSPLASPTNDPTDTVASPSGSVATPLSSSSMFPPPSPSITSFVLDPLSSPTSPRLTSSKKAPVRIHTSGAGKNTNASAASPRAAPTSATATATGGRVTPIHSPRMGAASPSTIASPRGITMSARTHGARTTPAATPKANSTSSASSSSPSTLAGAAGKSTTVGKYMTILALLLCLVLSPDLVTAKRTINVNFGDLYPIGQESSVTAPITSLPIRATSVSNDGSTTNEVEVNINYVHLLSGLDTTSNARYGVFCDASPPVCDGIVLGSSPPSYAAEVYDVRTSPFTTLQGSCRTNYAYTSPGQTLQCVRPGGIIQVRWLLKNIGRLNWKIDSVKMVSDWSSSENGWPSSKLVLENEVAPGSYGSFIGLVRVPLSIGIWNLSWSLTSECLGSFTNLEAPLEVTCSNGIFCDGMERLVNGECVPAVRTACDDQQRCTVDTCDESKGTCRWSLNTIDASCAFAATCTTPSSSTTTSSTCIPQCTNRVCGDDGCGGVCGSTCPVNYGCSTAGQCQYLPSLSTATCTRPTTLLTLDTLVGTHTRTVDLSRGLLMGKFSCSADATGPQIVFSFTVPNDGISYGADIRFSNGIGQLSTLDVQLELRKGYCVDPTVSSQIITSGTSQNTWCNDNETPPGGVGAGLSMTLSPGTYYLFAGSLNKDQGQTATLTARFTSGYTPNCATRYCGSDGGGGECGPCPTTMWCDSRLRCASSLTSLECTSQRCKNHTAVCGYDQCGGTCGSLNGQCPKGEFCQFETGKCLPEPTCHPFSPICQQGCNSTQYCSQDCTCRNLETPLPDLSLSLERIRSSLNIETRNFDTYACALKEGCVQGVGARRLLRFDTIIINQGRSKLTLPLPSLQPEDYTYSTCYDRPQLKGFAEYQLLSKNGSTLMVQTRKQVSCLTSDTRYTSMIVGPDIPCRTTTSCTSSPGLDRGWYGTIPSTQDCQWLDITNVPTGNYTLRVEVNAQRRIVEETYDNNVEMMTVWIP